MTRVEQIEKQIEQLTRQELVSFREWFSNYDADQWDQQIEKDVRAGKLNKIAEDALKEHKTDGWHGQA